MPRHTGLLPWILSCAAPALVLLLVLLCGCGAAAKSETVGSRGKDAPGTPTRPAVGLGAFRRAKVIRPTEHSVPKPQTLYERLGGTEGIGSIVDELVAIALDDPNVNLARQGHARRWEATPENVSALRGRLVQFFAAAAGGPVEYRGRDLFTAHRGMAIAPDEFNAFASALAQAMQQSGVPEREQKELLAIVEAVRGVIVEASPAEAAPGAADGGPAPAGDGGEAGGGSDE